MDNKETNNNTTNENVTNTPQQPVQNEVKVANNEIELVIDEVKKEEVVEDTPVEVKKEKKRLLPFIKNDDLFLLILAVLLVIAVMNLGNIYNLFSNRKFKLDPSPYVPPVESEEEEEEVPLDNNKYTLSCSKKNNEDLYVFDYVYTINYKGSAYQMIYETRSIDLNTITDQDEYNTKLGALNAFANESLTYLENASNINGSIVSVNEDGTFSQTIDLALAKKTDINKIEEVMFFEVNDSIDMIKTKFENNGYTCR